MELQNPTSIKSHATLNNPFCQYATNCRWIKNLLARNKMTHDEFRRHAREHFDFLVSDYDFRESRLPDQEFRNEYQVIYEKPSLIILIEGINFGYNISVRFLPQEHADLKHRAYNLFMLKKTKNLEIDYPAPLEGPVTDDIQLKQMKICSNVLIHETSDLLLGNYSLLREMDKQW